MDYNIALANRKTPWEMASWAQGQKPLLDETELATSTEMLEAAGLAGWDVRKVQAYAGRKGGPIPGRFATVVSNGPKAGEVLGDVGRAYQIFQMEDAFSFADKIVDDGRGRWERAGFFRNGSIVFGAMEVCGEDFVVPGDDSPVKPYLLVVNSFDGSTPYQGVLAFIRPVCINTFEAARGTDTPYRFNIRHTGSLEGKIQMARDALAITLRHTAEVKELTTALALKKVTDEQVLEIFRTAVWPIDDQAVSEGRLESHASTQAYENYLTSPTLDTIRGTAWGAFNAVTEFVDHVAEYKGKVNSADDVKGEAILFGRGHMRTDRAMAALLKV